MVAPPGVHEVNFPTIAAGDAGRVAISFPGSESTDPNDPSRIWHPYVVVSSDVLEVEPTFTWRMALDPREPVFRGQCGPGQCIPMGDFLDIQTSPADGTFWATMVAADVSEGFAISQISGSLWAPGHSPPSLMGE
jgi:hypothetical protein